MSKTCKVKLDKRALKQIDEAMENALSFTAYTLLQEIQEAQVVPKDTGNLETTATVDDSKSSQGYVEIVFPAEYAEIVYYNTRGYTIHRDKNPNAQDHWLRHWEKGGAYEGRATEIFSAVLGKEVNATLKG